MLHAFKSRNLNIFLNEHKFLYVINTICFFFVVELFVVDFVNLCVCFIIFHCLVLNLNIKI